MPCWLLFTAGPGEGLALRLQEKGGIAFGVRGKQRLRLSLEAKESSDLQDSARRGTELAYEILWNEKLVEHSVDLTYRVDGDVPRVVTGSSCDLAFALGFVQSTIGGLQRRPFSSLAATGVLDHAGNVQAVNAVSIKIAAALNVLADGGVIVYPCANDGELSDEIRLAARKREIDLRPVERLDEAIEALGIRLERVYLEAPYRGLEVFEYRYRSIFFGRQGEVETLVGQLIERERRGKSGALVIGPSGSGKSSFVLAGVLPALLQRSTQEGRGLDWAAWRPRDMVGTKSLRGVADSLLQAWRPIPDLSGLTDCDDLVQLAEGFKQAWPVGRTFVWIVDQLEELFTLNFDPLLVDRFSELVLTLQRYGVWVVGTLRADFYRSYQSQSALVDAFTGDGSFDLRAMSGENLRQVIELPALKAGYAFEEDDSGVSLATRLLTETLAATSKDLDPLPLLQFALAELYRCKDGDRHLLTWDAYKQTGGLNGAVAKHAEAHFSKLIAETQAALPRLVRALVAIGPDAVPVAQPVAWASIERDVPMKLLVEALMHPQVRLVTAEGDATGVRIRVAHEAVFTHWDRVRDLIEQNKSDIRLRDRISVDAGVWKEEHRADLLIPPGLRLTQAEDLLARQGDELEDLAQFINESSEAHRYLLAQQRAHDAAVELDRIARLKENARVAEEGAAAEVRLRKRTQIAASMLGGLLLFTIVIAALLYFSQQDAKDKQRAAERFAQGSTALRLLVHGQLQLNSGRLGRDTDAERGLLEMLAARRIDRHSDVSQDIQEELRRQVHDLRNLRLILSSEGGRVRKAVFSPDGKMLAALRTDVELFDVKTGQRVGKPLDHGDIAWDIAFSPDGQSLASAGGRFVRVWDLTTGERLGEPLLHNSEGVDKSVRSVTFSPDGRTLASGDDFGGMWLWDAKNGQAIARSSDGHSRVSSLVFSPGGKVVAGIRGDDLQLWDVKTGQAIERDFSVHEYPSHNVLSVAFSPNGQSLVSGGTDNTVRLWDVETGQPIGDPLRGHDDFVASVAFSPNGKILASGSWDKTVRLWNSKTLQLIGDPSPPHGGHVVSVSFGPDGTTLASASETARIWEGRPETWEARRPVAEADPVWFRSALKRRRLFSEVGAATSIVFGPDGKTVASGGADRTVRLWDAKTGEPVGEPLRGNEDAVTSVAFSPDGRILASGGADKTVRLWDAKTHQPGNELRGHDDAVASVAFSPDGKTLASGGADKTVRLWDTKTGQVVGGPLRGHGDRVVSVAFSRDGKTLASGSADKTVRLWDAKTGRPLGEPLLHKTAVASVAFSPDGEILATGSVDSVVSLWEARSGRLIHRERRGESLTSLAFSPDGKILAIGGPRAEMWDVMTRKAFVNSIGYLKDQISGLAFSPDGKTLAIASKQNSVQAWPVLDAWVDMLCAKLTRNMTVEEWSKWVGTGVNYEEAQCPSRPLPNGVRGAVRENALVSER